MSAIVGAPYVKGLPGVSNLVIDGDTLVKVKKSEEELIVPENIKHIARKAMVELSARVCELPDGLESIGSGAFAMSKLRQLTIPDSVTTLGTALFLDCEYIVKIQLGTGISSLTKNLIAFCDNITTGVFINGIIDSIDDSWLDGTETTVYLHEHGNSKLID